MRRGLFAVAALMGSVTGLLVGVGTPSSAGAAQSVATGSSAGHLGSGGHGSNARSGPAAGGSSGTVGNVAKSSFTLTTSAGQEVTVDEESSTKYEKRGELDLEEHHRQGRTRPRTGDRQLNDHQGHAGARANEWRWI